MAQNLPPPRPVNQSRGPSDASMNRYVPEAYPPQPGPYVEQGYRPSRSRGPSFANEQTPYPPYPPQSYGAPPEMQNGQYQRQPSYSGGYPTQQPSANDENQRLRPPVEPRRRSTSSTHSRRSHDSRRSHRSKRSTSPDDRPRRSHDQAHDRDRERRHHHSHDHRHRDDDRDLKPLKRTDTRRPSWGDTIYDLYDYVKGALGSKDRR